MGTINFIDAVRLSSKMVVPVWDLRQFSHSMANPEWCHSTHFCQLGPLLWWLFPLSSFFSSFFLLMRLSLFDSFFFLWIVFSYSSSIFVFYCFIDVICFRCFLPVCYLLFASIYSVCWRGFQFLIAVSMNLFMSGFQISPHAKKGFHSPKTSSIFF